MPSFVFALLAGLAPLLHSLVFRVLAALGFGLVTYTGLSAISATVLAEIASVWSGMGVDLLAMAYIMQMDRSINLLLSAYVARLTIQGMTALGGVSKLRLTP